jgi:cytochrome c2
MVDRDGNTIFTNCSGCHAILAQDEEAIGTTADLDTGMGFAHPQDGKFIENFKLCSNCHTGGQELYD